MTATATTSAACFRDCMKAMRGSISTAVRWARAGRSFPPRPGLFWLMLPLPTEAGLGALVSALDRGDVVVLYAATPEMIDAVCAEAAPLIGPGGHA